MGGQQWKSQNNRIKGGIANEEGEQLAVVLGYPDGNGDGSMSRTIEEASIQSASLLWRRKMHNLKMTPCHHKCFKQVEWGIKYVHH